MALLVTGSVNAQENVSKIPQGLLIRFGQAQVELAAATPDTLRLSLIYDNDLQPAASSFLADTNAGDFTPWRMVKKDELVGIKTEAGTLLMDPQNGEWTLQDAKGETLIPQHEIGELNRTISATNQHVDVMLGWNKKNPIEVYGCGNGAAALEQTRAKTGVSNGRAVIPYYWSKAGYAVLGVTEDDNHPASWRGATNGEYVAWIFPGPRADLYLMPAASLKDAEGAYARLTGAAPVPPRWAFGYLQSRWGWKNRDYIEDTLKHFHDLNLPVDAFIYDFEWFTTKPDYEVPAEGKVGYSDFGWNANLFPDPVEQISNYKNQGVHFVGIRKPRLGNSDSLAMMRSKGWVLRSQQNGFESRDVDFSNPELSSWYVGQSSNLISAGVDGWWNDEGEASYTTYFYWNKTEVTAWSLYRPNQRLWTLNRAFSPGTQRLGAAAWTGDINASWKDFAETPASLLNWSLAGMPYAACDIGGFNNTPSPELLTRWMEAGVFFPVMRSHSTISATPHFPWLYGTNALNAIRDALDLRYRLIPFYYSLAHETFETGIPLMRPLVMEFPDDPKAANLSDEWMMGDSILAAPVLKGATQVEVVPGNWLKTGDDQTGLRAEYFANEDLSNAPAFTRTDANIDFDWSEKSPAPDFPQQDFSARWTGTMEAPASVGEVKLATLEDDGARVWIDGNLVIDAWGPHDSTTTEASAALTAGTPHQIRVEYQQFGGNARIQLLCHPTDSSRVVRVVWLPPADWYVFGTNRLVAGNQTIRVSAALDEIPVYVRAGSILPLAPVIQHTSELPGGPLELQIYPGKDATFTLVEDDGNTFDYQKGQIRRTIFKWEDGKKQLSWKREGDYSGKDVFQKLHIVLFDPRRQAEAEHSLDSSGTIKL